MGNGVQTFENQLLLVLAGAVVLMLILIIALWITVRNVKRRYKKVVGNSALDNVDDLLILLQDRVAALEQADKQHTDALRDIRSRMVKMKANVAVQRYNAFAQQGNDLSFSVAILDEEQDGVVLTGIHGRDESYMYAKPVEKGLSSYSLSPEEKKVIVLSAAKREG